MIITLCTFAIYCHSQDTVYIEGLLIRKYLKDEILFKITNKIFKQQGQSYQQMIDYSVQSYFFTLKIDSAVVLMNDSDIAPIVCANQNYKNLEVYQLPDSPYIYPKDCQYYVNPKDSNYVYEIYNLKGKALRFQIRNDYLDKSRNIDLEVNWHIDSFSVNRNIPSFYLYVFLDANIANFGFSTPGFNIWKNGNKPYE